MIGFDQLELMIVFDQSGHVLVFSFWPITAHASFCPIRSKAHASFSPIWTDKKTKTNHGSFLMGFHVFASSSVVICSVPVFASITIISDSSLFHCLRYEAFEHNKFEQPTAILSRRDIIREMYVPNKALSSFKYFLFKHNFFCFLVRHGLPSEWRCSRCSISHDSWTWKATRSCYCGERRKSEF